MLTGSVLMVLFEPFGHNLDPRYLKPNILAFVGTPWLAKNVQFGGILLLWLKLMVLGIQYPIQKGYNV